MKENLSDRIRRTEFLITVSFTVFSVLMIMVTISQKWPIVMVPLNGFEIAFIWWGYAVQFRQVILFSSLPLIKREFCRARAVFTS